MALSPAGSLADPFLAALAGVKPAGAGKWVARCPAHDDRHHSLSIAIGADGRVLVKCHASCTAAKVVEAVGLTMASLFPPSAQATPRPDPDRPSAVAPAQGVTTRAKLVQTYDYERADGTLAFQVCRFEPKTFRQRRKLSNGEWAWGLGDVEPTLYRLPELLEAVGQDKLVVIVEGEKDADALVALGLVATTSPMGAGKWREAYSQVLAGARVALLPDNDDPGRSHAAQIAASLTAQRCDVRLVALDGLPPKGDVSDWLAAGGTAAQLDATIARTPRWTPEGTEPLRFPIIDVVGLESLPPLEWLVGEPRGGLFPAAALTALFGAPGSGKSFLAADLACSIADRSPSRTGTARRWLGHPIQSGPVLYVVAEGGRGFRHRIAAWRAHTGVSPRELDLHFVLQPVNLFGAEDVTHLLRATDALKAPPALVVFDTVARSMVGGDENSAQDMGLVIAHADAVKRQLGATVLLVHHARKDAEIERGSGALRAGVDTLALVREEEEGGRVLACEKQKDADPFVDHLFYLYPVLDSCVVTLDRPAGPRRLTKRQHAALKALEYFAKGATSTEWTKTADLSDRTFYRTRKHLLAEGYVSERDAGRTVRYALTDSGRFALSQAAAP